MKRALVGLLVGLLLAEGAVRVALAIVEISPAWVRTYGPTAHRLAWAAGAAKVDPAPPRFDVHPRWGWTNHPGAYVDAGESATVDADGRRVVPSQGSGPVVLLAGDSFTFGAEAADDATWAAAVQRARPDLTVVDLGVPGFGLGQTWARLHDEAPALEPSVLVVGLNSMMLSRPLRPFTTYRRPTVVDGPAGCALAGVPLPTAAQMQRRIAWTPRLLAVVDMATWPLRTPGWEAERQVGERVVDCLRADAEAWQVPWVLVWLPGPPEHAPGATPIPARRWFDEVCARTTATCADATPALAAAEAAGVRVTHASHWSAAGHAAVAEVVATALSELLPPAGDASPPTSD